MRVAVAPMDFVWLGIFGPDPNGGRQHLLVPPECERSQQPRPAKRAGTIEIALPNDARVCLDALANEKVLSQVPRATWHAM